MTISSSEHLKKLKNRLGSAIGSTKLVAITLAPLLHVSKEGVYRRLRGETSFTLEELLTLRKVLGISLDELVDGTENIAFSFKPLYDKPLQLDAYLKDIALRFKKLAHVKQSTTYNVCEDLPFFRQLGYSHLAAFKLFYWKHSILQEPEFVAQKFSTDAIPAETLVLAKEVYNLYIQIPSVEIWTAKTISNTLSQVDYFYDCGLVKSNEELKLVYWDLLQLLDDVTNDARLSKKTDATVDGSFMLHLCELSLENNSIYLETNQPMYLATGFNSFNSLHTTDTRLLQEYRRWLTAMLSKSINISGQAERIRHDFYTTNRDLILKSANQKMEFSAKA